MTYFFIFCFGLLDVKSKYYTVILYSFDEKRFDFDVKKNIICVYKIKRSRENCKIKHLILFVYLQFINNLIIMENRKNIYFDIVNYIKAGNKLLITPVWRIMENHRYFGKYLVTFSFVWEWEEY